MDVLIQRRLSAVLNDLCNVRESFHELYPPIPCSFYPSESSYDPVTSDMLKEWEDSSMQTTVKSMDPQLKNHFASLERAKNRAQELVRKLPGRNFDETWNSIDRLEEELMILNTRLQRSRDQLFWIWEIYRPKKTMQYLKAKLMRLNARLEEARVRTNTTPGGAGSSRNCNGEANKSEWKRAEHSYQWHSDPNSATSGKTARHSTADVFSRESHPLGERDVGGCSSNTAWGKKSQKELDTISIPRLPGTSGAALGETGLSREKHIISYGFLEIMQMGRRSTMDVSMQEHAMTVQPLGKQEEGEGSSNTGWGKRKQKELDTFNQVRHSGSSGASLGTAGLSSGKDVFVRKLANKLQEGHKLFDGWMRVILLALVVLGCSTPVDSQHLLTLGEQGRVLFDVPWDSGDRLLPYFTITFKSQVNPFCTLIQLHLTGFKTPGQYNRFSVSYTLTESSMQVTVEISDVSPEDAGVYIMALTSIDGDHDSTIRVVKEVEVSQPLGKAHCRILEAPEGYDNRYAEVSCRAFRGGRNATLTCYQDGVKIPYIGGIRTNDKHVHGRFWMKSGGSPVHCCSHDYETQINRSACHDFVWPLQEPTAEKSQVTASGQGPQETPNVAFGSACGLHVELAFVCALLAFSVEAGIA